MHLGYLGYHITEVALKGLFRVNKSATSTLGRVFYLQDGLLET